MLMESIPGSECDSPITLVNLTLDHLHQEWSNNIDFVIWTGDSARHDNDNLLPRTPSAIYEMNRSVSSPTTTGCRVSHNEP